MKETCLHVPPSPLKMEVSEATCSLGDQTTLTLATMTSEKEARLKEAVEQLQAGLFWLPNPKKVLIYMKRLNDLPMTVGVLAETGIGETVESLCKYAEVGAMARNIVGQWKKLGPVDEDSDSNSDWDLNWEEADFEQSTSRKRPHAVGSRESDFQKTWNSSFSRPPTPGFREKKDPKMREPERSLRVSPDPERREERKGSNQTLSLDCSGSSQVQLQPSTSLQQVNIGSFSHRKERDQKSGKGSCLHIQDKVKAIQEDSLGKPSRVKPGPFNENRDREYRLLCQKEKYQVYFEGQKEKIALSRETLPTVTFRDVCQMPPSRPDTKEKQNSVSRSDKDKESCSVKKRYPPLEFCFVKQIIKTKHQDATEPKVEKPQLSKDLLDVQTQEGKYKAPSFHKSTVDCLVESGGPEPYEKHDQPTTSRGSHFHYAWQPQSKKTINIPIIHENKGLMEDNNARTDIQIPNSVPMLPKMNDDKPEKQPSGAMPAKLKTISTDVTPHLGDTILPITQESGQIPSHDSPLLLKAKKRRVSSYHEEEEIGFIGQRINSKMHVYSGPKYACQPKLISLHQQCIRVLNNHLDSIFAVGNVPYTVLEPVLEKCTPKQLRRIEEYNHLLIKDTDQLWKIHCNRDFKKEEPREFESWRQLYCRLQEAREQRLLLLIENFRSSHSNKPKGRQTMMACVNSVTKPPRVIRKNPEKFGPSRAAFPKMIKLNHALYSSTTHHTSGIVQRYAGPSTSNNHSTSAVGSTGSCDFRRTAGTKFGPSNGQNSQGIQ